MLRIVDNLVNVLWLPLIMLKIEYLCMIVYASVFRFGEIFLIDDIYSESSTCSQTYPNWHDLELIWTSTAPNKTSDMFQKTNRIKVGSYLRQRNSIVNYRMIRLAFDLIQNSLSRLSETVTEHSMKIGDDSGHKINVSTIIRVSF